MKTFFAPPDRADGQSLNRHFQLLSSDPLVDNLMRVSNGLFAVLNEQRQIISINDTFLKMMGMENGQDVLGLRPGEYVHCIHADEMEGGCGTSQWCNTCGAAISIMSALQNDTPMEDTCALSVEKDGKTVDLFLQVRCCSILLHETKFILLYLEDISVQQQRAHLEQTFFHDINNMLQGVMGKSEIILMKNGDQTSGKLTELHNMVLRMAQEIALQKSLSQSLSHTYQPLYRQVEVKTLLDELEEVFASHPLAASRFLEIIPPPHRIQLLTDPSLVNRILVNMVTNALEASAAGDGVSVFVGQGANDVTFCVNNRGVIPEDVSRRIFQRNFSTKKTIGRGLGTYSMKFFGETVLGGRVCFTSSESEGTTFMLSLLSC